MTDLNNLKISTPGAGNTALKFVKDNAIALCFGVSMICLSYSMIANVAQHRAEVQEVAKQNAACIYLESSKLGEGQHYMICEGQIVLKRIQDAGETTTPEQKLNEVIPTEAASAAPSPEPGQTPPKK